MPLLLSVWSLFVGVLDIDPASLLSGDMEQIEIFLISRLPRLLVILLSGSWQVAAGTAMTPCWRIRADTISST